MAAQELLNRVMVSRHQKQEHVGTILKNQADVQTRPNLEQGRRQLADAQTAMPVGMAEIVFHRLQRPADLAAGLFGIPLRNDDS
jgi:hypothetical protein